MKLILLDTGRPSLALVIGDDILVFDCGTWITLRLCQAGIHPNQVTHLFLTHIFHYDHTCNYYDFLMSIQPGSLNIYGPPRTEAYTEELLNLHAKYGETRTKPIHDWIKTHTMDVDKGTICSRDDWKVIVANMNGQLSSTTMNVIVQTMAYRVEHGDFSTVIAWDTHPLHPRRPGHLYEFDDTYTSRKELMHLLDGADLVIADAGSSHTTPEGIGIAAEQAKVKKLLLTHISDQLPQFLNLHPDFKPYTHSDNPKVLEPAKIKERIKKVFSGEVRIDEGLSIYKIELP